MSERLQHVMRAFLMAFALVFGLNAGPAGLAIVAQRGVDQCVSGCPCDTLDAHDAHDAHDEHSEHGTHDDVASADPCDDGGDCADDCPDCDCDSGLVLGLLPSPAETLPSDYATTHHTALANVWTNSSPSRLFIPPISPA